jgi:hypothetical protein
MIRPSGSRCIGRNAGRNCATPACVPMRRRRTASDAVQPIRRALDLMGALKLGVHLGLDEIRADEFVAMLIAALGHDLLEREKSPAWRGRGTN